MSYPCSRRTNLEMLLYYDTQSNKLKTIFSVKNLNFGQVFFLSTSYMSQQSFIYSNFFLFSNIMSSKKKTYISLNIFRKHLNLRRVRNWENIFREHIFRASPRKNHVIMLPKKTDNL